MYYIKYKMWFDVLQASFWLHMVMKINEHKLGLESKIMRAIKKPYSSKEKPS